jgi:Glu-tRNA(Gln) amidotransferase subunit E-like FAD-binding protein
MEYSKLGMKAGLEIHQQIDSGKLFSRTPSLLRSDEPHYEIRRKLHRVAGESGDVDVAVEYEAGMGKEFAYQGWNDTISLVELDESPPQMIEMSALEEALKIALLLNCEIYPVTQIMRKTVIDGSNTSGFQRTLLLAHDGYLEMPWGKVGIQTICLEEDSCRPGDKEGERIWKLDRLGIPLVEIATSPDMHSAEQIKETALKIGEILRACRVKRGIGTIRQDLNISIKGHDRVEIKGFQDSSLMIRTVELEVQRQIGNVKNGKTKGEVRGTLPDGSTKFNRPMPGKDRMYPETDLPLLYISREMINNVKKMLPRLKQDIRIELKKKGLTDEMINLVLDEGIDEFNVLMRVYDKDANLVAKMITLWRSELASKLKKTLDEIKIILNEVVLEKVLEYLNEGKISEGDVKGILQKIANGTSIDEALIVEKVDDNILEEQIRKIIAEKPGMRANAYMGLVITKLGASVDKRKAMQILNKLAK